MTERRWVWIAGLVVGVALMASCGGGGDDGDGGEPTEPTRAEVLANVSTWGYQLQGVETSAGVAALDASTYEMLVVDVVSTVQGEEGFNTAGMVSRLKSLPDGGRRLVIAYVDIGQAEDFRTYWAADWEPPTLTAPGKPDFIVCTDPDGWAGDYPVAYWDAAWKAVVFGGADSLLQQVLAAGFDGIYMDWVGGFQQEEVVTRAGEDGVDPADEMIRFIRQLRQRARAADPEFLVIPQNAPDLVADHPEYLGVIDAVGQEDVHFSGGADAAWGEPGAGDVRTPDGTGEWERQWLYGLLDQYLAAGKPVFTIDYCVQHANAAEAYRLSRQRGYVPFVTQTPLDRLP